MMIDAKKLVKMRETRRLTQSELGYFAGMDQAQISRIENGMKDVTLRTLIKLMTALGLQRKESLLNDEAVAEAQLEVYRRIPD